MLLAGRGSVNSGLVARVRRTLNERGLMTRGARVLVACSGGPDSAALLFALSALTSELDLVLEVASVDHGLRVDAAKDVECAHAQAQQVAVPFHALRVEVAGTGSLQAAARDARYAALRALAAQTGATRIAVGHTQDDQAETVLLRLLRGTGLPGLSAIAPLREDGVVRPLIDCRRAEALAYAQQQGVPIARDPSNQDPAFSRVRVREELLEWLVREDPQVIGHLATVADDARDTQEALLPVARAWVSRVLSGPAENVAIGSFDISDWLPQPRALVRLALRELVRSRTGLELGRAHIEQLDRAIRRGGEVWLPRTWIVSSAGDGHVLVTLSSAPRTQ